MIRAVLYLLFTVLILTLVRALASGLGQSLLGRLDPRSKRPTTPRSGGELRRDPVCGTYVSEAVSVKKTIGQQVVHFCSTACRDKYRGE
jgi:YHS domain-containing protein